MLTEQSHTEPNWKLLPGAILDGGYELEELLQADERRAKFKIRVLGDRTIDALASFFPVGGTAAEEQLAAWDLLRRVPHSNLSKPLAAGRRQLERDDVIYIVLRRADETLSGVLGERPLTTEEASEVLLHSTRALDHLNRHGLVHASISPEEVLAVGDSIQLSAEGVTNAGGVGSIVRAKYVAPESATSNSTQAAAVWCLGATIFETLTQKPYSDEYRGEARNLPVLGWIVDRCLDLDPNKRCKPEEIPALLKAGPPRSDAKGPRDEKAPTQENPPIAAVAAAAGANASSAIAAAASISTAEVHAVKPAISSASQARTKAFQQAGFDSLAASPGVSGGGIPRSTASAGLDASLASPAFESPSRAGTVSRALNAEARLESPRAGAAASGVGQSRSALYDEAQPELGRREARAAHYLDSTPQRSRLWMYAAAGAVLLLLMIWALRSKPAKTSNTAPAVATPLVQNGEASASATKAGKSAAEEAKAWPTRTLEPDKSASGAVAGADKPVVAAKKTDKSASGAPVWRVVVYTFNRREDAEKRAHSLNARHSHLEAQVFSPHGHSAPFLVTVGGKMTREDAAHFRSKAVGWGVPHDSYIQNYAP